MAAKQYQLSGHVTLSMLAVVVFQGFYVWDALYAERAILSTMDITTDGFGCGLVCTIRAYCVSHPACSIT
jgi:Delta14-sterol reductase